MARGYSGNKLAKKALLDAAPHLQPKNGASAAYIAMWKSVVEDFPPTHFKESDRGTLHNYIMLSLNLRRAEQQLEHEGFMLEGPHGPVENPVFRVVEKLSRVILAHARSLKIVPSARANDLQVPKDSEHLKNMLESKEEGPEGLKLAS